MIPSGPALRPILGLRNCWSRPANDLGKRPNATRRRIFFTRHHFFFKARILTKLRFSLLATGGASPTIWHLDCYGLGPRLVSGEHESLT